MSQFLKGLSAAESEQEKDGLIKEGISQMLDADLRERWDSLLENEQGKNKSGDRSKRKTRIIIMRGLAIAASIAILITVGRFLLGNPSLSQQALNYLEESVMSHPGVTKGPGEEQVEQRVKAIAAYTSGDFQSAADQFSGLDSKSVEDLFFQATANLYAGNYQTAINQFDEMRKNKDRIFRQEINWFLALALIIEGEKETAATILQSIESSDWHSAEASKLLSELSR